MNVSRTSITTVLRAPCVESLEPGFTIDYGEPAGAAHRLAEASAAYGTTGKLQAVWKVKEQQRVLLPTGSLADEHLSARRLSADTRHAGESMTRVAQV